MTKAVVTIYTSSWCGHCLRAKALLERHGIAFEEINVEDGAHLRAEMASRSGRRSVPQLFVGDRHIGGSDELAALAGDGRLAQLLAVGA